MDQVIQVQMMCEGVLVETPTIGALVEEPLPNVRLARVVAWSMKHIKKIGLALSIDSSYLFVFFLDRLIVRQADVLKRSVSILQTARLCGTTRLMFDSEVLSLTCQSTEKDNSTSAANVAVHHASRESSTQASRRNRRSVTFSQESADLDLLIPTDERTAEVSASAAEEQSLHYR